MIISVTIKTGMKLIASITFALVTARSRVADSDLKLDAYGEIHREKIHLEELLQSWNRTMGTAPPRGWYRMRMEAVAGVDPNEIIKKSGLEGKTATCKCTPLYAIAQSLINDI